MEQKKRETLADQVVALESTLEQARILIRLVAEKAVDLGMSCTDDRLDTIMTLADLGAGVLRQGIEQAAALELVTM